MVNLSPTHQLAFDDGLQLYTTTKAFELVACAFAPRIEGLLACYGDANRSRCPHDGSIRRVRLQPEVRKLSKLQGRPAHSWLMVTDCRCQRHLARTGTAYRRPAPSGEHSGCAGPGKRAVKPSAGSRASRETYCRVSTLSWDSWYDTFRPRSYQSAAPSGLVFFLRVVGKMQPFGFPPLSLVPFNIHVSGRHIMAHACSTM